MRLSSLEDLARGVPGLVPAKHYIFRKAVSRRSKTAFLQGLRADSRILDVGCGSNSPYHTKEILPDCHYTGIDVSDYNHTKPITADRYVVTTPDRFAGEIAKFKDEFDAVISSHNLEHCDDRDGVLNAMLSAVRPRGLLYLSFPCEDSVNFPHRKGTLNYYDDDTHKREPPDFNGTLEVVRKSGFEIVSAVKHYKPPVYWLQGLLLEAKSRRENQVYYPTWAYYGFESILWARKAARSS